ncbi:MAG: V-type ATP synthase subunit D [Alphaproteobacteria bacterium]|jgi:V/A-type H+-transporting ATPase subunit D|nr:V-type ATP synthase subunit D [Alphaproteobacteria bacterium]
MAKVALNKSSLTKQKTALKGYKQFLPSLELKQQQLKGIEARAKKELKLKEIEFQKSYREIEETLPMIANEDIYLEGLIKISSLDLEEENLLGLKLPKIRSIFFETKEYSFYNTIHWIDSYIHFMKKYLLLYKEIENLKDRLDVISKAVLKITQRVNLFEKVLIPDAQTNIKKIKIAISDDERAAVVRSKIAKAMHEKERGES